MLLMFWRGAHRTLVRRFMEAVRRFEQAHLPAYKLKDARLVERGIAPESVRRRVERVQNREIHRPTREEGLRRATDVASEANLLPFQRRAEAALTTRAPERPIVSKDDQAMRTAETMEAARCNMAHAMARLGDYLPEGAVKDDLMRRSRDILARAEAATKEQDRLERNPGQIEGDRFVEPEPRNVGALFTNEKKGAEIHYSRHDRETGAFQTLAFIDSGKQLDVRDWSNSASVNAALKLASQKWETVSVNGSDEYKETAARLAAENGYKITNPELQDRIRELRAEMEARRATVTQGKERPAAKEAGGRQQSLSRNSGRPHAKRDHPGPRL